MCSPPHDDQTSGFPALCDLPLGPAAAADVTLSLYTEYYGVVFVLALTFSWKNKYDF